MSENANEATSETPQEHETSPEHETRERRTIFISHRYQDRRITNVLRDTLINWSLNTIDIFQSTDPQRSPRVGQDLTEELKEGLATADVVLLIYTYPDHDWSYCMWECGVATDPKDNRATRIVVFQCTETSPGPFHDRVRVLLNEEGIKKFTFDFHKDPSFFPHFGEAFAPDVTERTINDRSRQLFNKLRDVIPESKREERRRWDMLRMSLDVAFARQIEESENAKDAFEKASDVIPKECVIRESFGEVARHFGFEQVREGMLFGELIKRWQETSERDLPNQWINGLYEEIMRSIRNVEARPTWNLMKSARADLDWWFVPIINHVRILPELECLEFDLYFYRIPADKEGHVQFGP